MILSAPIPKSHFRTCVFTDFGEPMVKLVADLGRNVLAYDAEWHADLEAELLEDGSIQSNLWGFNYYFDRDALEYNSLINIRPAVNRSSDIQDPAVCEQVKAVFLAWAMDE
jgi:hypothetical protein